MKLCIPYSKSVVHFPLDKDLPLDEQVCHYDFQAEVEAIYPKKNKVVLSFKNEMNKKEKIEISFDQFSKYFNIEKKEYV